jgi:hypothetical protein
MHHIVLDDDDDDDDIVLAAITSSCADCYCIRAPAHKLKRHSKHWHTLLWRNANCPSCGKHRRFPCHHHHEYAVLLAGVVASNATSHPVTKELRRCAAFTWPDTAAA